MICLTRKRFPMNKTLYVTDLDGTLLGSDRIIAFGDGLNDLPMVEIADECYAVSNAVDELKAIATGIIESNNADGVAKWLSKHVIL